MNIHWKLLAWAALAASAFAQMPPQTIRVGTFHQPSVVVAFYRSPLWAERLKSKIAERDAAKRAGDAKLAADLEAWGKSHQELAHRQLAGESPIGNILEALTPSLPEIARKAQVAIVVPELPYANSLVQAVDVTEQILDALGADEATRRIVRDLRKR